MERLDREGLIGGILGSLRQSVAGLEACAVISSDALPLASLAGAFEEDELSRHFAMVIEASERAGEYLETGELERVYLKFSRGYVVIFRVNEDAMLACALSPAADMDKALRVIRACASRIASLI